jgi:hypothetical protein
VERGEGPEGGRLFTWLDMSYVVVVDLGCGSGWIDCGCGAVFDFLFEKEKGIFWTNFLATSQKLTPKFSAFFVVFVGKEITINIVQN